MECEVNLSGLKGVMLFCLYGLGVTRIIGLLHDVKYFKVLFEYCARVCMERQRVRYRE